MTFVTAPASRALALGELLPMIARLQGHAEVLTRAHYAHSSYEALNTAAARIADSIGEEIPARQHLAFAPLRGGAGTGRGAAKASRAAQPLRQFDPQQRS